MDTPADRGVPDRRRIARAEAAAWIVRLHGPDRSPELEAGLRAWLGASPENARQFERVTEVWDAAGTIPVPGVPRVARWKQPSRIRNVALAATVLLACALGFLAFDRLWLNPTYSTGIGEQRLVRLSDGSRVSLNASTQVQVSFNRGERRVRLDRGEAYFEVARNAARPFVVVAGEHQVTALGTAFVVRYEADRTAVTLVEGKVAVATRSPFEQAIEPYQPSQRQMLSPGQRLTFLGGRTARLDEPRIDAVTAWRRGEVMLDETMLADAVAEMNRYDVRMLVIDDPAVAALRISGIYHAGDSSGFAQTIAELYGLQVIPQEGRIHLRSAASPSAADTCGIETPETSTPVRSSSACIEARTR
jgi:transmembrane sensor